MSKVKCLYCGQFFNWEQEPYIKVGRRYAHAACSKPKKEKVVEEEHLDSYHQIMDFMRDHFGADANYPLIQKQLKTFLEQKYTYNGIYKSLVYYYDVLKSSTEKGNGGIGIVPYVYEEARKYYLAEWTANKNNKNKQINTETETISINPPEAKKKKRKLFSFLDKEEDDSK